MGTRCPPVVVNATMLEVLSLLTNSNNGTTVVFAKLVFDVYQRSFAMNTIFIKAQLWICDIFGNTLYQHEVVY